jgi:hypothetical protein
MIHQNALKRTAFLLILPIQALLITHNISMLCFYCLDITTLFSLTYNPISKMCLAILVDINYYFLKAFLINC